MTTNKYEWQDGMGEISGMGGEYESACRKMLFAGLKYMDENPQLKPEIKTYKNIYGMLADTNEDAEKLSDVIIKAVDDCSGAMHQAVMSTLIFIKKNGWNKYIEEMKKREDKE